MFYQCSEKNVNLAIAWWYNIFLENKSCNTIDRHLCACIEKKSLGNALVLIKN